MNSVIGVTGHRKLLHSKDIILKEFDNKFKSMKFSKVITGMALGFDQLIAEWCIVNNVPFIAAVPFETQAKLWNASQIKIYLDLLEKAEDIVVVSSGEYVSYKMQVRNEWIVNNSDIMIAYCFEEKGGTITVWSMQKENLNQ